MLTFLAASARVRPAAARSLARRRDRGGPAAGGRRHERQLRLRDEPGFDDPGELLLHERIRLVTLAARYDPARNLVHFHGTLVRSADDLRPTRLEFKGAADCNGALPRLIVWSM